LLRTETRPRAREVGHHAVLVGGFPGGGSGSLQIDVRTIALRMFWDKLILFIAKPLAQAIICTGPTLKSPDRKRLQQM
jgi:hypothetical protein